MQDKSRVEHCSFRVLSQIGFRVALNSFRFRSVSPLKLQHSGDWKWNCLPGNWSVLRWPDNEELLCTIGCCLLVRTVGDLPSWRVGALLRLLSSCVFPSFLKTYVLLPPGLSLTVNRTIAGMTRTGQGPASSHSLSPTRAQFTPVESPRLFLIWGL